ncbi:hypothetical protein EOD42_17880 [Rhodovarius crocodyli]|uniref:Flavin reductase like domain-containing protein n=2 Tax=Rhodovarius crocodyli TaxID=1979269 RepID=A0A437MCV6_9PROT|nr:hypothetical protein EOD42_17880 [Rhodovarius crocodyli]
MLAAHKAGPDRQEGLSMDKQEFRGGMSRLAAAVNVITTGGAAGRAGFTASAVTSVTDEPPTLLVCMNRNFSGAEAFAANGVLCVNTLGAGQEDISNTFAGRMSGEERFSVGEWETMTTGAPALKEAAVSFDCEIRDVVEQGSHKVLFAEVKAVRLGSDAGGLVYFNRNYHLVR